MAAMHPYLFQAFVADESKICKLVLNHFLPDHVVLHWRPATNEDLSTPNINEIMVFSSFFNADSASRPVISFAESLITIKLN
jgi:hypothetical protein